MTNRYILALCAIALLGVLAGCAGSGSSDTALPDNNAALVNSHIIGPDVLSPDDSGRDTSATFRKFFTDTVNQHSVGRWQTTNSGGYKQWTLMNTYYSSPKAWIMGGNYYNYENDVLQSVNFTVDDGTNNPAVSFYARWEIEDPGDQCVLQYWEGFQMSTVATFAGGSNPSYPDWDKYYFQLPSNFTGFDQSCYLKFTFTSDSSINGWGFGVDSVNVYQTLLNPPINVEASDGTESLQVTVTWDHNNAGNLVPSGYIVYGSDTPGGPYGQVASATYPDTSATHISNNETTYYYVVQAFLSSHPNSVDSNEDSGFGGP